VLHQLLSAIHFITLQRLRKMEWKTKDLYGGSIRCDIPVNYVDISEFRDVPDHQEVFAHPTLDQSIIVEINERVCYSFFIPFLLAGLGLFISSFLKVYILFFNFYFRCFCCFDISSIRIPGASAVLLLWVKLLLYSNEKN
jgi:hypothetical protein